MLTFINARLVMPEGVEPLGYLSVSHGQIVSLGPMESYQPQGEEIQDCKGLYVAPGFIDLHTHGGGGYDFMDGTLEAMVGAARAHLKHGTTTLLPTTLTSSDEELFTVMDTFHRAKEINENMPELLGLHLEGPYLNGQEKGAQDEKYVVLPEPEHYEKIALYANGAIKRWSLAPELPGAIEMIGRLAGQGIMFSAAHTAATFEHIKEARSKGLSALTHFYSAMSTIVRKQGRRVLGVVESGYLLDDLWVELIADGEHLPPDLLKMILKCKDHDRIFLCTDSMRGAGMPDGPSILGSKKDGQEVIVEKGIALMPDKTCFAGSVATTDRLVRVMVHKVGLPIWETVKMVSLNPAQAIGCDSRKGSLECGKDADIVLFDDMITIKGVYVKGVQASI